MQVNDFKGWAMPSDYLVIHSRNKTGEHITVQDKQGNALFDSDLRPGQPIPTTLFKEKNLTSQSFDTYCQTMGTRTSGLNVNYLSCQQPSGSLFHWLQTDPAKPVTPSYKAPETDTRAEPQDTDFGQQQQSQNFEEQHLQAALDQSDSLNIAQDKDTMQRRNILRAALNTHYWLDLPLTQESELDWNVVMDYAQKIDAKMTEGASFSEAVDHLYDTEKRQRDEPY